MKLIVVLCLTVSLYIMSTTVLAFNADSNNEAMLSLNKKVEVSPSIYDDTKQDRQLKSAFEFNYVSVEFNVSYSDLVISNTAPVVNIQDNSRDYYLQSKISLPGSKHFNIAMTASFNQQDKSQNSFQQIPLTKSFFIIEKNQSAHYGLIGHYQFSPKWHISGGVIHSLPILEAATSEANNLAIFGTTYSF